MAKDMRRWKEIQHSMAIEGFEMSDSMLEEVVKTYEDEKRDEEIEEVFKEAKRTGRSVVEVAREKLIARKRRADT